MQGCEYSDLPLTSSASSPSCSSMASLSLGAEEDPLKRWSSSAEYTRRAVLLAVGMEGEGPDVAVREGR